MRALGTEIHISHYHRIIVPRDGFFMCKISLVRLLIVVAGGAFAVRECARVCEALRAAELSFR